MSFAAFELAFGTLLPFVVAAISLAGHLAPRGTAERVLPRRLQYAFFDFITREDLDAFRGSKEDIGAPSAADTNAAREEEERGGEEEREGDERTPLLSPGPKQTQYTAEEAHRERKPDALRVATLIIVSALQACLAVGALAYDAANGHESQERVWDSLAGASWIYAMLRTLILPPFTPPFDVLLIYVLHIAGSFLSLFQVVLGDVEPTAATALPAVSLVLSVAGIAFAMWNMPLDGNGPMPAQQKGQPSAPPDDYATLGSWVTFSWMNGLIKLGTQRDLDDKDIYQMAMSTRSSLLLRKVKTLKGTLLRRMLRANIHDAFLDAILTFCSACLNIVGPFCLSKILGAISDAKGGPVGSHAYGYAAAAFAASVCKSQTDLQHLYHGRRGGVRIRGELISLIFDKALRSRALAATADKEEEQQLPAKKGGKKKKKEEEKPAAAGADLGAIASLMSVDSQKISILFSGAYFLYDAPVGILVASLFLYRLLGWSAAVGFTVLLISTPLQSYLTKRSMKLTRALGEARDKRTAIVSEMYAALRHIRYLAQESEWNARALEAREKELALLKSRQRLSAFNSVLWVTTPAAITSLSFYAYIQSGHQLTIAVAFPAIAVIQSLRTALNILPIQITALLNAGVSLDRIATYLATDEVPAWVSSLEESNEKVVTDGRLGFENASFMWPTSANGAANLKKLSKTGPPPPSLLARAAALVHLKPPPGRNLEVPPTPVSRNSNTPAEAFCLQDLNVIFPKGQLSLISGPTASGKSSLLSALLGEMQLIEGQSFLPKKPQGGAEGNGQVSYCSQRPWLQHATIRDNILFGAPLEPERYTAVIRACALQPDLAILPAGDLSEIGEGGISLSGGQRARVALARAVYSRAQTVLLDDILAAVDSGTARKLIACINGPLMQGRTIVMVTHHVDLMLTIPVALVVKLEDGLIETMGSPAELRTAGELSALKEEAATEEVAQEVEGAFTIEDAAEMGAQSRGRQGQLVTAEKRAKGHTKFAVYKAYFAAFGYATLGLAVVALLARQAFDSGEKFYLSFWGSSYRSSSTLAMLAAWPGFHTHAHGLSSPHAMFLPPPEDDVWPYLLLFVGIQLSAAVCLVAVIFTVQRGGRQAARTMFAQSLQSLLSSTSRYIDVTPSGRVLSRLSADQNQIDESCYDVFQGMAVGMIGLFVSFVVVSYTLPAMLLPSLALAGINFSVARSYVRAARSLRRIESTSKSPLFSRFSELLTGLDTVRAFSAERRLLDRFLSQLDRAQSAFNLFWMANRWALYRLDLYGAAAMFTATTFALAGGIPAGLAGVALSMISTTVMATYWLSRYQTSLDVCLNSVERLQELIVDTPQEPPPVSDVRPPPDWPAAGGISVKDLTLRYAPELPPVLHSVSFDIKPGEKVGVCGRTGSGKSTLALAFFRFVEFDSGSIEIDGMDISKLGIRDLRSNLTMVAQDPTLFTGTIRSNLDPFNQHTDEACNEALRRVKLTSPEGGSRAVSRRQSLAALNEANNLHAGRSVSRRQSLAALDERSSSPSGSKTVSRRESLAALSEVSSAHSGDDEDRGMTISLDTPVAGGSVSNLSQGQRQLVAMARALLRASKIIIMDEASSSVDFATDRAIQEAIRQGFKDSTVITIAHRLNTILTYDKILVLDAGCVKEFDTPQNLMNDTSSQFHRMCVEAGLIDSTSPSGTSSAQFSGTVTPSL